MKKVKKVKKIKSKIISVREIKKGEENSEEKIVNKGDVEFQEVKVFAQKNLEEDVADVKVRGRGNGKNEERYRNGALAPTQKDVEKNYEVEQAQIRRLEENRGRRSMMIEQPRQVRTIQTGPPRIEVGGGSRNEESDRRGENYIPRGEVKKTERRKLPWEA